MIDSRTADEASRLLAVVIGMLLEDAAADALIDFDPSDPAQTASLAAVGRDVTVLAEAIAVLSRT